MNSFKRCFFSSNIYFEHNFLKEFDYIGSRKKFGTAGKTISLNFLSFFLIYLIVLVLHKGIFRARIMFIFFQQTIYVKKNLERQSINDINHILRPSLPLVTHFTKYRVTSPFGRSPFSLKWDDVIYGRPYIRKEESDFLKMLQSSKNTGSTQIIVAIMLYGKLQHGM